MGIRDMRKERETMKIAERSYALWDSWQKNLSPEDRKKIETSASAEMAGRLAVVSDFRKRYPPEESDSKAKEIAEVLVQAFPGKSLLFEGLNKPDESPDKLTKLVIGQGVEAFGLGGYPVKSEDRRPQNELFDAIPRKLLDQYDDTDRNFHDVNFMTLINRFRDRKLFIGKYYPAESVGDIGYVAVVSAQVFLDYSLRTPFSYDDMNGGGAIVLAGADSKSGQLTWNKIA